MNMHMRKRRARVADVEAAEGADAAGPLKRRKSLEEGADAGAAEKTDPVLF